MGGRRARGAGAERLSPAAARRRNPEQPARGPGREESTVARQAARAAPLGGREPDAAPRGPRRPGRAHRSISAWGLRRRGDSSPEEGRAVTLGVPGAREGPRGQPGICPFTLNLHRCTPCCTAPDLIFYTRKRMLAHKLPLCWPRGLEITLRALSLSVVGRIGCMSFFSFSNSFTEIYLPHQAVHPFKVYH